MRFLLAMLLALALGAGAALAQYTGTVTTPTATTVTSASTLACPPGAAVPGPCAAMIAPNVNGSPVIFILGSEERYAISNLPVQQRFNWRETAMNYPSFYWEGNPLTYNHPNRVITRHGNPYYPYYATTRRVSTPSTGGNMICLPASLGADAQNTLSAVANRYRTLTPQQAVAMGYQPLAACIQGVGQVYLNQPLVDNVVDPMTPEAFSFDPNGRILAVHYIVVSPQQVIAFGQPMMASPLVQGAQQLPVWLFQNNRNGLFALTDTSTHCPRVASVAGVTGTSGATTYTPPTNSPAY